MDMLKYAYNRGYRAAIKEAAEVSPEQMRAAQMAGGVGGGLAGAAGGGLLGKYLGGQVGEALHDGSWFSQYDPTKAQMIGAGLGGLLGAGAGGVLGSQIPKALNRTAPAQEQQPSVGAEGMYDDSALGVLPSAYGSYDPYAEQMYQQAMGAQYPDYGYGGY